MTNPVFLVDVDNTLLDNDQVRVELEVAIIGAVGPARASRFWELYEQVRAELDLVNFPETLERFSRECDDLACLAQVSEVLYPFPFADCLYPGALDAIAHPKSLGQPSSCPTATNCFSATRFGLRESRRPSTSRCLCMCTRNRNAKTFVAASRQTIT